MYMFYARILMACNFYVYAFDGKSLFKKFLLAKNLKLCSLIQDAFVLSQADQNC